MKPSPGSNPIAPSPRPLLAPLLVVSGIALAFALWVRRGSYNPTALIGLAAAIPACAAGLLLPPSQRFAAASRRMTHLLLAGLLGLQFVLLFWLGPRLDVPLPRPFYLLLIPAALGAAFLPFHLPRALSHLAFALVCLGFLLAGTWMIRHVEPYIDVFEFQAGGSHALLHGLNPYAIRFRDIYPPANSAMAYGPGVSTNGFLNYGFPYPPLSLLMVLPGSLLGDIRYSHLLALVAAAGLIAYAHPSRRSRLAAAAFLLTPISFFILEQSWTEPLVVFFLSLTVFCACRLPRWMPYALGLLLASKQYSVLMIFPALFLLPQPWNWRQVGVTLLKAAAAALVVTLPLALWNLQEFVRSVVLWQFVQPFRTDALSFLPALTDQGSPEMVWFALSLALLATFLAFRGAPRTPAGFAASLAFIYLLFFAFNKQAFGNYYFLVLGALACAVAIQSDEPAERA